LSVRIKYDPSLAGVFFLNMIRYKAILLAAFINLILAFKMPSTLNSVSGEPGLIFQGENRIYIEKSEFQKKNLAGFTFLKESTKKPKPERIKATNFLPNLNSKDLYVTKSNGLKEAYKGDYRTKKLQLFLEKYNSPLSEYAAEFVIYADRYRIDWRLVTAISGVESTFGKHIPQGSYNAYGWNNGDYKFKSWPDSIEHVTKTLREKYLDKNADTITKIARRYAPPSSTWGKNVVFFMQKIDPNPIEFDI